MIFSLENIITLVAVFIAGFVFGMLVNQICQDQSMHYPVIPPFDPDDPADQPDQPGQSEQERRHERSAL